MTHTSEFLYLRFTPAQSAPLWGRSPVSEALHLDIFHQPQRSRFFDASNYYLNLAPTPYYGLKRLIFKARFMILILTIWVICLRVKIIPTSL